MTMTKISTINRFEAFNKLIKLSLLSLVPDKTYVFNLFLFLSLSIFTEHKLTGNGY